MSNEGRIKALLLKILDQSCTPEEACAGCPDLLPAVRSRLTEMKSVERKLGSLFPSSIPDHQSFESTSHLPQIEGYEVQGILGRGAMGVVYQAKHQKLNRLVALKMLLAGFYASPIAVARFVRESQAVAELQHPHIVQVHDVGEVDGLPFYTMEFVAGKSLAEELAGIPQPARRAAELVGILAEAIHSAHTKGIIHRDLKPSNILLTEAGIPKVADFGLARHVDEKSQLTMSDARVGTPSYMAPEQALGRLGIVGPSVDIYALGAILYEMLTGRPPFRAETVLETQRQVVTVEAAPPSRLNANIPRDLETICLKCLQKDPHRRYDSAQKLASDLERFLNGQPILARPIGIVERCCRWAKRNQTVAAALVVVAVLVVLIVTGSLWAAAYFRKLDGEHQILAQEKGELADQKGRLLAKAVLAEQREAELRRKSESLREEVQSNLYLTEMNLAGQAASTHSGIGRVAELLANWDQVRPDLRNWEWYYLNSLCHQSLSTRSPHTLGALYLAWSPDGQRLASAGLDRTICISDEYHVHPILRLFGHTNVVYSVSWSPDGQHLASASWDHTIRIWDVKNGAEVFRYAGHTADVFAVSWSPDGQRIASSDRDGVIKIWNAADGTDFAVLTGHKSTVAGLSWLNDSRLLASASHDSTVRIWDAVRGVETRTLSGHINWVNNVAWSPDGTKLASASNDETLRIWNPENGESVQILRGHTQGVSALCWSPDSKQLASSSEDQTIKVWQAVTGAEAFHLRGHRAALTSVAWTPDGSRIASAGYDSAIKIWDVAGKPNVQGRSKHDGPITALAWSSNNPNCFASGDSTGAVKMWDATRSDVTRSLPVGQGRVHSLAWHPSSSRLAVADASGIIRVWDMATQADPQVLTGHIKEVYSVFWNPNGSQLASGGADKTVRIWDVERGRVSRIVENHKADVVSVAWSPDGRRIASASQDSTVKIWNLRSDEEALCYRGHQAQVLTVAWNPDGSKIASAGYDLTVHIWDTATGEPTSILHGHSMHVVQVAWCPDGTRLASVSKDGTVKLWDVAAGKEALTITSHSGDVNAVAWNQDGTVLLTGGMDRQIRVHDAATGYLAARAPRLLSAIDKRLRDNPSRPADWKLRAEVDARQREWNRAAVDVKQYLSLDPSAAWFIPDCWVAGPYPNDLSRSAAPEQYVFFDREENEDIATISKVNWQIIHYNAEDAIDLGAVVDRRKNVSAYAFFPVYSLQTQKVAILLGSTNQIRLWSNGTLVYESLRSRDALPDEDAVVTTLNPGWNRLLVRAVNGTDTHALYFRLSNSASDLARASAAAARATDSGR